ncbi:hypothetical protein K2173_027492 [Erythroxylum novogranatense]|uniref:F-box domain-containing protein n=1 Tax=Erythroxylum novogranatense TaxID=1862640 RepID=A0AAV8TZC8_9ROSI|nr:hypothetical protein K2173_027492 [Erythroxylum novogranatense]
MTRKVRRKLSHSKETDAPIVDRSSVIADGARLQLDSVHDINWKTLPDDTVIQIFSYLNYRDRASLSSTCQTFRLLGSSPCLWDTLDLRFHQLDAAAVKLLSSRSKNTWKLQFRGPETADAIIILEARGVREISCDFCQDITDSTLAVIAARHEMLESLQFGPDACERISSDAIKAIALCCPRLKKLQMCGVCEINADAINALATNCQQLMEIAFLESDAVDELALGNLASVRYLSIAGTRNLKWGLASQVWSKLPNLEGLDVSRTDISLSSVMRFLALSQNLKFLFALNCPEFEAEVNVGITYHHNGKVLITVFSDILKALSSSFTKTVESERNVFASWRKLKDVNRILGQTITWIEWILSHLLLRIAENNSKEFDAFWIKQGASILVHLLQSPKQDVQERAATAIATFVVIDDENATVDSQKAEIIMCNGGIQLLLDLARSCHEGLQCEAAKAIANLSVDSKVAKFVAESGGISILANLAKSMNKLVAEEAAGGLWNLSVGEEHKGSIAEAGGIKALVNLIFKWPSSSCGVLERAAGALANLAADDKCSIEVAAVRGIQALVMLTTSCKFEGVLEQAARALSNLAAHGDTHNASVGQEPGALEALVQLTYSHHEGVRQEAAGALWNLSFEDKNREAITAAGGVVALVSLAKSCSNSSQVLQERAAGSLWGLSVSESNSVAIGEEGGIAPLIALACSDVIDVHETAAGALWNLAFNPGNALHILEDGGIPALVHLCSSSQSRMARFMAALALAYVFDGRMEETASAWHSSGDALKIENLDGVKKIGLKRIEEFVLSFSDPSAFATIVVSSASTAHAQVAEVSYISEAGYLRCSLAEIGRFVAMLRSPYPVLRACSAFALLQFTMPGGRHSIQHSNMLQSAGAPRVLRATAAAAAATATIEAKVFAKLVLRNLEHHHMVALD